MTFEKQVKKLVEEYFWATEKVVEMVLADNFSPAMVQFGLGYFRSLQTEICDAA